MIQRREVRTRRLISAALGLCIVGMFFLSSKLSEFDRRRFEDRRQREERVCADLLGRARTYADSLSVAEQVPLCRWWERTE